MEKSAIKEIREILKNGKGELNDALVEKAIEEFANQTVQMDVKDDTVDFFLWGLCSDEANRDMSGINMDNLSPYNFARLTFGSDNIFSAEQIEKFHPEKLLKEDAVSNFPEQAVEVEGSDGEKTTITLDGEGTTIVIIDGCFDSSRPEFIDCVMNHKVWDGNQLRSYEQVKNDISTTDEELKKFKPNHHGMTTAYLAVAKEGGGAPKANAYFYGHAEGIDNNKTYVEALKDIYKNGIVPDIISYSAVQNIPEEDKEEVEKIVKWLEENGCTILDSDKYWNNFLWGRTQDDGNGGQEVVLDASLEEMLAKGEKATRPPATTVVENIKKAKKQEGSIIIPCTGKTVLKENEEKEYKYMGTLCGASFAIPQMAAYFLRARQIDKTITFDEFIGIIKTTAKTNREGMKYFDPEEMIKGVQELDKFRSENSQDKNQKASQTLGQESLEEQKDTFEKNECIEDIRAHMAELGKDEITVGGN